MNAIILGGESPRHQQWVQDVRSSLEPHFGEIRALNYRHWAEGDTDIDLEAEVTGAATLANGLENYIVVAKSIGTVVASLAIARDLLHPERCVFLGLPLGRIDDELPEVAKAMTKLPPTAFLHNEFDKVGTAEAVRYYLEETEPPKYSFQVVVGNATHDYIDFGRIAQLATTNV